MADLRIFGEPFDRVSGTIREQLYISCLRSELFGDVYATHAIERVDLGENNFRACSVMKEYTLRKKDLFLCEEAEKPRLDAFREAWTVKSPEDLLAEFPATISQRQDRILQNLHVMAPNYGDTLGRPPHPFDCFARNQQEYFFFLELLRDNGLIAVKITRTSGGGGVMSPISLTAAGWQRLEYLEEGTSSTQAFVAMSFAKEMDGAFLAIQNACKAVGFSARRIDTKEHNNEIVGEILYEITRSRFVVADVTGQRQGVYFEAGYAIGIRKPVIWTCKKDDFEHVHFDASHFNHIVWVDENDLSERLAKRIQGTILVPASP